MSNLSKIDPSVLKHLFLADHFHDAKIDFNRFKNLKHLHLYNSVERKSIDEILLSDSLEILILTCYELNSIDRVAFPIN